MGLLKHLPDGRAPHLGVDLDTERDDGDRERRRELLCVRCRQLITDERERIEQSGRHRHVFANPHGIAFEIGCFARALGCLVVGPREHQLDETASR